MFNLKPLLLVFACALAAALPPPAPPLEPGEALALAGPDGIVHLYGEASRESAMGSLAKLVWVKLEGAEWSTANAQFKCAGSWQGLACSASHGRVDLAKGLQDSCDLAFLAWARFSAGQWLRTYGDGAARARLEDAFEPFLGKRMPAGDSVPMLDGAWMGQGDLLRASPESMLKWLMDPAQDEAVRRTRRLLLSFVAENFRTEVWWISAGSAQPGAASAWAVGSNGRILAVLRLPPGQTRVQALARFMTILMIPK